MAYAQDWGKVFNKATPVFTTDIRELTKREKTAGAVLRRVLEPAQTPIDVLTALVAIDKISLAGGSPKEKAALPANVKLFQAGFKKLTVEVQKYAKELDEIMKTPVTVTDPRNQHPLPTPLKTVCPDTYRQLKILHTEIAAIRDRAENALLFAQNGAKRDQIEDAKDKAKSKVVGDSTEAQAKVAAISEEAALKIFVMGFATAFKSAMSKGAAVIQKIKASPDVATYNEQMNGGARDISQNLLNLIKLRATPKYKGSTLAKKIPDPAALGYDVRITPFAHGDLRRLPDGTSPAQVKAALEQFTALYKAIAVSYKDVLSGKYK